MKINNILADAVARILSSIRKNQSEVLLVKSKQIEEIVVILRTYGYIHSFRIEKTFIRIILKYSKDESVLKNIKYYSQLNINNTVSFRQLNYLTKQKLALSGLSLFILSTPLGIISDYECLKNRKGGKLLLRIF
uniref:Ribosomal protein S8 n=1 Tax=Telonemida sp. TaxID=2652706 RepID=A0A5P8DJY7_9EUKA|nr:ribosomal protein S8 [Telonemida sp.]